MHPDITPKAREQIAPAKDPVPGRGPRERPKPGDENADGEHRSQTTPDGVPAGERTLPPDHGEHVHEQMESGLDEAQGADHQPEHARGPHHARAGGRTERDAGIVGLIEIVVGRH